MKNLLPLSLIISTLSTLIFLNACGSQGTKAAEVILKPKAADEISIMNFNVENLFDNIHDKDRDDHAYLSLAKKQTPEHKAICAKLSNPNHQNECLNLDWNDDVIAAKLKNLAQIILGVDGNGPDILVMEEVENDRILSRLNKEALAKAGYQTQVLIEGFDTRGIDIALLSRFPLAGTPELHRIPYAPKDAKDKEGMAKSRGLLEVPLKLPNGEKLIVLGAHFPSQANPGYWRQQAVNFVTKLIKEKSATSMVIASGDLNITRTEEEDARYFKDTLSSVAMVSHMVGCQKCAGTHNYRKDWSFLDAMLFSKNMDEKGTASYKLDPTSIRVINSDPLHLWGDYPKRFKPETKDGVADHFPIYARLVPRPAAAK